MILVDPAEAEVTALAVDVVVIDDDGDNVGGVEQDGRGPAVAVEAFTRVNHHKSPRSGTNMHEPPVKYITSLLPYECVCMCE